MKRLFDEVKDVMSYSEFLEALENSVQDLIYEAEYAAEKDEDFRETWKKMYDYFFSKRAILRYAGYEREDD